MKKYLYAIGMIGLLTLCACGKTPETDQSGSVGAEAGSGAQKPDETGQKNDGEATEPQDLVPLVLDANAYCNTQEGYYYITEDTVELRDGTYGSRLMYMDFATQQEVYLCSDAGCSHDDESCSAVLCDDEFVWGSSRVFIWNGSLYILSKESDDDGVESIDYLSGEPQEAKSMPAALYQMDLDGTNRKKVFTFEDGITLEDCILADSDSLYFVSKKLETNVEKSVSVTNSTDRKIIRLTPSESSFETVQSLNFDDGVKWQVMGRYDHSLILQGVIYPDGFEASPNLDDDAWREGYLNSRSVYAVLDLVSGELTQVYQIENRDIHSSANRDGILYISSEEGGRIEKIDLRTGEQSTLAEILQGNIVGTFSDTLICRTWNMADDYTMYFVDTADGTVSHCGLTNKYNGWALDIMGETQNDAVVIYDYDADPNLDGSYEIYQYKFALITKEDLLAGKDNFRPIQMTGKGI